MRSNLLEAAKNSTPEVIAATIREVTKLSFFSAGSGSLLASLTGQTMLLAASSGIAKQTAYEAILHKATAGEFSRIFMLLNKPVEDPTVKNSQKELAK